MARWWSLGRASRPGVGGDGPTSRIELLGLGDAGIRWGEGGWRMLVVVWAGTSEGGLGKPPNESIRLVGGCRNWCRGRRGEETHQRVEMTRWWPLGRASRLGVGGDGPTSRIDSLGLP